MKSIQFPRFKFIGSLLEAKGRVYLVGGTLRDALLGIGHKGLRPEGLRPKDFDLLVQNIDAETLTCLLKKHGKTNIVGRSFGVVKFIPEEMPELEFDLALPRTEKSTGTGHSDFEVDFDPQIPVEKDLGRRDFTVNAMAYDLETQKLVDPFGGEKDLEKKILRQVFPRAFEEDPLRLLRAVQFSARFQLKIEPSTLEEMKKSAPVIKTVSRERIIEEVRKLFLADRPSYGFDLMRETGLLDPIFPFVTKMIGVLQPMKKNEDVYQHTMKVVDAARASLEMEHAGDMEVMFSSLFHDAGKPYTVGFDEEKQRVTFYGHQLVSKKIARRWLADYKATTIGLNVDQVLNLIENHMFETKSFYSDRAIRRFVAKVGPDTIFKLIDLRIADKKGGRYPESMKGILNLRKRIRTELNKKPPFGAKDLAVNGHDIITLGFKPGPTIGHIQKFLVERVLDEPELNEKEKLMQLIKENFLNETKTI